MACKLKILVAPLDWGLGHTTRCLPVIHYLLENGHTVIAAAQGVSATLLKENFPALQIIPLPGYGIRYSRNKNTFAAKIVAQIPKITRAIRMEKRWLERAQAAHHFDLILSDNRYGLYHPGVPCIIMTHQLQIKTGMGTFADHLLQKLHYRLLEKFTGCWIVDEPGNHNLSGSLAHPHRLPRNARYIGLLSQMGMIPALQIQGLPSAREVLVLLSGPEPMRSMLEKEILLQISCIHTYHFTVVAGDPSAVPPLPLPAHITYHSCLPASGLRTVMQQAALVVCRSGYSSLMDLAVMGKRALLIPTPGQTEQEYLAARLRHQGWVIVQQQRKIRLKQAIPAALALPALSVSGVSVHTLMHAAVDQIIRDCARQEA